MAYVVEPTAQHSHTFILLHGLGSWGEKFGMELLNIGVTSSGYNLQEMFPAARFVFPTSQFDRRSAANRASTRQWFDIVCLEDPSIHEETQVKGLIASGKEIREIIHAELQQVQPENLILGGLSQGCAMSLAVLLSLEFSIGGYIGMSGFLTYQKALEVAVDEESDEDNPFEYSDDVPNHASQSSTIQAQAAERDLLNLPQIEPPSQEKTAYQTPVFLGHGGADDKVPCALGEAAAQVMRGARFQVVWKCYEGQGHCYKVPDEINDICNFISSKVGWKTAFPINRI